MSLRVRIRSSIRCANSAAEFLGGRHNEQTENRSVQSDEMPRQWYNLAADLPQPPPPPLGPDGNPIGPEALGAGLPDEPHRAGGVDRALDRHPGGDPRNLRPLAAVAPAPRLCPREAPRDAGQDLLQGRERVAGGQPQTQHRGRPGLVQQGVRDQAADHRDRRRPVGLGAGLRRPACRHSSARSTWSRSASTRSPSARP